MRFAMPTLIVLLLTACADLPVIEPVRAGLVAPEGYPELVPLAPILAEAETGNAALEDADQLAARANALGNRRIAGDAGLDSRRIEELRRRAAVLRGDASDLDALRDALR